MPIPPDDAAILADAVRTILKHLIVVAQSIDTLQTGHLNAVDTRYRNTLSVAITAMAGIQIAANQIAAHLDGHTVAD